MTYNHIFGPVLSRRLGISLGVDLVTHKICSLDCVYCESGKTTRLTKDQKAYVCLDDVLKELDHFWAENDDPDYITFSGSGEPTLNPCMGKVIDHIKENKPGIKVAVLTNATLFDDPQVHQALLKADRVVPSLDAATKEAFVKINRPHRDVDLPGIIRGLEDFCRAYTGELYLEVFILPGVNDGLQDLQALKKAVDIIQPDRVQINTLDRPGTVDDIRPATREELDRVIRTLGFSPVEIIARVDESVQSKRSGINIKGVISETVLRRPCTRKDLIQTLGADPEKIDQALSELEQEKKIKGVVKERGVFYLSTEGSEQEWVK